jgi:hypothetical protein
MNSLMGGCLSFDDDASLVSRSSADAIKNLLQDLTLTTPPLLGENLVIDITDNDDSSFEWIEPLPSVGNDAPPPTSWKTVFSDEERQSLFRQISSIEEPSFDHDETNIARTDASSGDGDISYLMTKRILEPETPVPAVNAVMGSGSSFHTEASAARPAEVEHHMMIYRQPQDDVIARLRGYIYHFEQDRQLALEAEEIVQDCIVQHQRGRQGKYRDLPRAICERLAQLFGDQKFNEIYHNSIHYHFLPETALSAPPPSTLHVAVAYGIHLARLDQATGGGRSQIDLIEHGVEALHSMNEQERNMFWGYITTAHQW